MKTKEIASNAAKYIGRDVYMESSHYPGRFIIGKLIFCEMDECDDLDVQFEYSIRLNEYDHIEQFALTHLYATTFPEDADITMLVRGDDRFPKSQKAKFAWETYERFLKSGMKLKVV